MGLNWPYWLIQALLSSPPTLSFLVLVPPSSTGLFVAALASHFRGRCTSLLCLNWPYWLIWTQLAPLDLAVFACRYISSLFPLSCLFLLFLLRSLILFQFFLHLFCWSARSQSAILAHLDPALLLVYGWSY